MPPETNRERALAEFHDRFAEWSFRQKLAVGILIVTCGLPAITVAGFTRESNGAESFLKVFTLLDPQTWLAISAVAGTLAGAILYTDLRFWYVGVVPGLAAGPSVFLATFLYSTFRTQLHFIELTVPFFAGITIPYICYYYLLRWRVVRDIERNLDALSGKSQST